MTEADWKRAEEQADFGVGVKLKIDGYDITILKMPISQTRLVYAVYINGAIRMKSAIEDCEERRRFFCRRTRCMVKTNDKVFKKLSKKRQKEVLERFTYEYFEPWFTSFRTLKAHFIKNNSNIELAEKRE